MSEHRVWFEGRAEYELCPCAIDAEHEWDAPGSPWASDRDESVWA